MFETLKSTLMRFFAVIMCFVSIITGGGLGKMTVIIPDEITTESEELVYEVVNGTGLPVQLGENFALEKKNGNTWESIETIGAVRELIYSIPPMSKHTFKINIVEMFGEKFALGEYRITVDIPGQNACITTFSVSK